MVVGAPTKRRLPPPTGGAWILESKASERGAGLRFANYMVIVLARAGGQPGRIKSVRSVNQGRNLVGH